MSIWSFIRIESSKFWMEKLLDNNSLTLQLETKPSKNFKNLSKNKHFKDRTNSKTNLLHNLNKSLTEKQKHMARSNGFVKNSSGINYKKNFSKRFTKKCRKSTFLSLTKWKKTYKTHSSILCNKIKNKTFSMNKLKETKIWKLNCLIEIH